MKVGFTKEHNLAHVRPHHRRLEMKYPDFNTAVELHRFLDNIQEASVQGRAVALDVHFVNLSSVFCLDNRD